MQGMAWEAAMGSDDLLDTADVPGLLVLHGPSPLLDAEEHFQCFVPHRVARSALHRRSPEIADQVFAES